MMAEKRVMFLLTLFIDIQPDRIRTFLSFIVPETLTFTRKPIPSTPAPTTPNTPRSPLLASDAAVSTSPPKVEAPPPVESTEPGTPIFGSVSTTDIVTVIREHLAQDPEASRLTLDTSGVRFVGPDSGLDRVKALGKWEIEIAIPGGGEPVVKRVEVIAG
jgi:hypothetical protein